MFSEFYENLSKGGKKDDQDDIAFSRSITMIICKRQLGSSIGYSKRYVQRVCMYASLCIVRDLYDYFVSLQ